MKIEVTKTAEVIEYTPEHEAYFNPYYGCTAGCPFCYWLSIDGWEGKVEVREDLPQVLEKELEKWVPGGRLFMGSYCDPYMEGIEDYYGITRKCLEVVLFHDIPLTVVSSLRNDLILRDLDLLKKLKEVTVVVELCRLDQMEQLIGGAAGVSIRMASRLVEEGIHVMATVAPYLPGITDLHKILKCLDERIPVYTDPLDIKKDSVQEARFCRYIEDKHPELSKEYEAYLNNSRAIFELMLKEWGNNPRVKRFPIYPAEPV